MILDGRSPDAIAAAVRALSAGELLGLPTETVYGLAADAASDAAVAKIFAAKGRPSNHPLIVHVAEASGAAHFAASVPDFAHKLIDAFWPGPLTLILPRRAGVVTAAAGGQDSIGLRCPSHPVAQAVLRACAAQGLHGLAAPSANAFGRVSPTTAAHVQAEFGDGLLVLDGGACDVGIESTIIDCTRGAPVLLRPGGISRAQVEAACGQALRSKDELAAPDPRASGTLEAHYAPRTPLLMLPRAALESEARQQGALGKRVAILGVGTIPAGSRGLALPEDAQSYAHGLYAALRQLDAGGQQLLLVERPPEDPAWLAVQDRLRRAAAGAEADDDSP